MFSKLEKSLSLFCNRVYDVSDLAGVVHKEYFVMDTEHDSSVEFMKDVSKHVNTYLPFALTYIPPFFYIQIHLF